MPAIAAEIPITLEAARRLSLEEPRLYLESSPYWLSSAYSAAHPEWRRELLLRRGRAAWLLSDRALARDAMLSLNELARSADMPLAAAYAMILEADELTDFGQYTEAIERVSKAATILRATKDPYWRAIANAELCDVYWGTEQGESAVPYCRRAEKYFRSTNDDWYLARIENALAMLHDAEDEDAEAIATAQSARERFERLQMPSMVAMIDDNLSSLYLEQGDAQRALEVSQHALALETSAGKAQHSLSSHVNVARALSALGRHDEALAGIESALAIAADHKLSSYLGSVYFAQMEVAEAAGKFPLALAAARAAIDASYELNTEQRTRAVAEIEARYKADEQRREIERLDQEQRIRELELARSQEENARQSAQLARQDLWLWLIGVSLAALLAVSVLLFALWRSSRRHARRMRLLADTDGLTGVCNRRAFVERMQACHDMLIEQGGSASICVVDADHFKRINDTRGHQVGDRALQRIARLLGAGMDADAAVGRMGGEEFALLLPRTSAADAMRHAEQLRLSIAADHERADGLGFPISVSIGVAQFDAQLMPSCESWLVAADKALYRAKANGRNRCELALPVLR
ncbi:MAG TPA: diguanylate cyclase [Xanthomonadales bacterium]|nr:diguanylate cyclase [Xanthomonadales bacterium]